MTSTKLLLTYKEAADMLGVSRRTVADWVNAGALRTVNPNGRDYIPASSVDEMLAGEVAR